MADREKVMRGLEHCLAQDDFECVGCPYDKDEGCVSMPLEKCRSMLKCDALALLKEQEAVAPNIVNSDVFWSCWYVCGSCDNPIDPGDKFCRHCGKAVKWEPPKEEEGDGDACKRKGDS